MSVKRRKLILALAVIFAVNILIIALAQTASAGLYKKGMSGDMGTSPWYQRFIALRWAHV